MVSEDNERGTSCKSADKKKSAPRSDTEDIATILAYMQNEWQSKDQLVGFWCYGRKEQGRVDHTDVDDIVDW